MLRSGASTNATLALVEVIPHSDLAAEDMPVRYLVDLLMLAFVDGKERSQVIPWWCDHRLSSRPLLQRLRHPYQTRTSDPAVSTASWLRSCAAQGLEL